MCSPCEREKPNHPIVRVSTHPESDRSMSTTRAIICRLPHPSVQQGPSHFLSFPRWGLALLCGVAWAGLHGRYTQQCRNSAEALPSAMQCMPRGSLSLGAFMRTALPAPLPADSGICPRHLSFLGCLWPPCFHPQKPTPMLSSLARAECQCQCVRGRRPAAGGVSTFLGSRGSSRLRCRMWPPKDGFFRALLHRPQFQRR